MTNRSYFEPFFAAVDKAYVTYSSRAQKAATKPFIHKEGTSPGFTLPVTPQDIRTCLESIPPEFTKELDAVILLRGHRAHRQAWSLYSYGVYFRQQIFLIPYPKDRLSWEMKRARPSDLHEYVKCGARVEHQEGGTYTITFDAESLRLFYLREVLTHEVGHHVAWLEPRSTIQQERFCDWFAEEYGYRFKLMRSGRGGPPNR